MSAQEKPLPTNPEGHCPHWKVPGRLIHWTGGSAEQAFGLSVHSSTSTVQAVFSHYFPHSVFTQ
jgi:hypothetical protein